MKLHLIVFFPVCVEKYLTIPFLFVCGKSQDFVLRVCSTIETFRVPSSEDATAFKETDKETEERKERVNGE